MLGNLRFLGNILIIFVVVQWNTGNVFGEIEEGRGLQLQDEKIMDMKEDVEKMDKALFSSLVKGVLPPSKEVEERQLVNQVLSIMQMSKSNSDVITQAFRYVKLDAHLATLLSQLSQLREFQETLQGESIKRQTRFNVVLDEIRNLAANVAKESVRLTEVEERLESEIEMMNDRIDSALEKIIQSAVSTQLLLDLSKETIQQTDKSVGISNEILMELKSMRTELGDVGQASVQTIYNVQRLEESLLIALEDAGNKTIYALRQEPQLEYQVLPLPLVSPMKKMEDSLLVPLGNGREGNSIQADGTISLGTHRIKEKGKVGEEEEEQMSISSNSRTGTTIDTLEKSSQSHSQGIEMEEKKEMQELQDKSQVSPCTSYLDRSGSRDGRPRNCQDIQRLGHSSSGVYRVYPFPEKGEGDNGTEVYCDLLTDEGGWTVIQRRKEPLLIHHKFERNWTDYAGGFGILHDSYFLGLDVIHKMTEGGVQLRVDMMDWGGKQRFAKYHYFRIANDTELYRMFVTDYIGDAGDSLAYHNGMPFTTKDRDNDLEKNVNCAVKYGGAWWYKSCHQSNLNGRYLTENNGRHSSYADGINWYTWHGYYYSLKRAEMKIRSRDF